MSEREATLAPNEPDPRGMALSKISTRLVHLLKKYYGRGA